MKKLSVNKLCELNDIEDGGSAGFTAKINDCAQMVIAVRKGAQIFVYINSCPHIGTPLDFHAGKFLSRDKKHILCSTHGALFEIENGHCIFGPCRNSYLEMVPIAISNGDVLIV